VSAWGTVIGGMGCTFVSVGEMKTGDFAGMRTVASTLTLRPFRKDWNRQNHQKNHGEKGLHAVPPR